MTTFRKSFAIEIVVVGLYYFIKKNINRLYDHLKKFIIFLISSSKVYTTYSQINKYTFFKTITFFILALRSRGIYFLHKSLYLGSFDILEMSAQL